VKAPEGRVSKRQARFESPAQGPHHCAQCTHYRGGQCTVVRGYIAPGDWCEYWTR